MTRRTQSDCTEHAKLDEQVNFLTEKIIGATIEVHRVLGCGLLESACQRALAHELQPREIAFEEQKSCAIGYKNLFINDAYRLDFLVSGLIVAEVKAVAALLETHAAQVLTYLKFTGCRVGLLFNFHECVLTRGLRRLVL